MSAKEYRDLLLADCATRAASPDEWRQRAYFLFCGAAACRERYVQASAKPLAEEHVPDLVLCMVAPFLAAIGVEVLLKAVLVKRDPAVAFTSDGSFYTHDLITLVEMIQGLNPTTEERNILRRLRTWIEWVGRYPNPKLNTTKPPLPQFDSTGGVMEFTDDHWAAVISFKDRLESILNESPTGDSGA